MGPIMICSVFGYTGPLLMYCLFVNRSWVAKLMVEKGYTVRGTVRSATNPRSVLLAEDFKSIPGDGKLVLFEADILQESTLTDALFQDAEYVFHVASPFFIKGKTSIEITLYIWLGNKPVVCGQTCCQRRNTPE